MESLFDCRHRFSFALAIAERHSEVFQGVLGCVEARGICYRVNDHERVGFTHTVDVYLRTTKFETTPTSIFRLEFCMKTWSSRIPQSATAHRSPLRIPRHLKRAACSGSQRYIVRKAGDSSLNARNEFYIILPSRGLPGKHGHHVPEKSAGSETE